LRLSIHIVYFSNYYGNTKLFVEKMNSPSTRIPIKWDTKNPVLVRHDFVLFVPTYGGGSNGSAIPRQIKSFLNIPSNRSRLRGVVGFGNTNFGEHFCKAEDLISKKTGVPIVARVEIFGTPEDVDKVNERMRTLYDNE